MTKCVKAIILSVSLYLFGVLGIYIGLFKGRNIAINVSRPAGAISWVTNDELFSSCTYFPVIIGISLIILSILFASVLFKNWLDRSN